MDYTEEERIGITNHLAGGGDVSDFGPENMAKYEQMQLDVHRHLINGGNTDDFGSMDNVIFAMDVLSEPDSEIGKKIAAEYRASLDTNALGRDIERKYSDPESALDAYMRGVKRGVYQPIEGAKQFLGNPDVESERFNRLSRYQEFADQSPISSTLGVITGNMVAGAPALLTSPTVPMSVLAGGAMGALQYVDDEEDRATNAAIGATGGLLPMAIAPALKGAATGVKSGINALRKAVTVPSEPKTLSEILANAKNFDYSGYVEGMGRVANKDLPEDFPIRMGAAAGFRAAPPILPEKAIKDILKSVEQQAKRDRLLKAHGKRTDKITDDFVKDISNFTETGKLLQPTSVIVGGTQQTDER